MSWRSIIGACLVAAGLGLTVWLVGSDRVLAQSGSCPDQCRQQYGQCYSASKNRDQCTAALQRCMSACPTPAPGKTAPTPPGKK